MTHDSKKRRYTAPPQAVRCTGNVVLRDGSGAACMHHAVKDGRCRQHPLDSEKIALIRDALQAHDKIDSEEANELAQGFVEKVRGILTDSRGRRR